MIVSKLYLLKYMYIYINYYGNLRLALVKQSSK